MDESELESLLRRWAEGDTQALAEILDMDRDWLRGKARRLLPHAARGDDDSMDVVQNGVLRLLRYRLEHQPANRAQFRALVGEALQQVVQDRARWHGAEKRVPKDRIAARNSEIERLDEDFARLTPPPVRAERSEVRARVALALEMLEPDDRKVIELRMFEGLSFPDVAQQLGVSTSAAAMRFTRAKERLKCHFADRGEV